MTRKEMKDFIATCKEVKKGYCCLQDDGLSRYSEGVKEIGTNSGVYGWNCDIYVDNARDIAITTGYRNMRGQRIPDEIIRKYDEIAKEIIYGKQD